MTTLTAPLTLKNCERRALSLFELASTNTRFDESQADVVVHSLCRVYISKRDDINLGTLMRLEMSKDPKSNQMKWMLFKFYLQSRGHLPYKVASTLKESVQLLRKIVGEPGQQLFEQLFHSILSGGRWQEALAYSISIQQQLTSPIVPINKKPWVVLVMGCNGIRKTTSVYQKWFTEAVAFSLGNTFKGTMEELPNGKNSFFRQLDYIMACLANVEFKNMYKSECCIPFTTSGGFTDGQIQTYMNIKGGVFARYRSLCESLGGIIIESAIANSMNVIIETSGKDIASFHYIDNFFSDDQYRKLVVNFTVTDLQHAKDSVNQRMQNEMLKGYELVRDVNTTVNELISVNCGGPYGGDQLAAVEEASKKTWNLVTEQCIAKGDGENPMNEMSDVVTNGDGKGSLAFASTCSSTDSNPWSTWYKAHIEINGGEEEGDEGWYAVGVNKDDGIVKKSNKYATFDRQQVNGNKYVGNRNSSGNKHSNENSDLVAHAQPKKRRK